MEDLFNISRTLVELRFDGGCQPNPGRKYGSYSIKSDGKQLAFESRFELGVGTNNEAEFEALLKGLCALSGILAEQAHGNYLVRIYTDSRIVKNHLCKTGKRIRTGSHSSASTLSAAARRDAMIALADECKTVLRRFGGYEVVWQGRAHNVAAFGH